MQFEDGWMLTMNIVLKGRTVVSNMISNVLVGMSSYAVIVHARPIFEMTINPS